MFCQSAVFSGLREQTDDPLFSNKGSDLNVTKAGASFVDSWFATAMFGTYYLWWEPSEHAIESAFALPLG